MHPDIDDFGDSENETVQWDDNNTYGFFRLIDTNCDEESLELFTKHNFKGQANN